MKTKIAVCLLAGILAIPAGVALFGPGAGLAAVPEVEATATGTTPSDEILPLAPIVEEDIELPAELQDLTGCEALYVLVTDAGEVTYYFYNWVWDEEHEEWIKQACDPVGDLPDVPDLPDLPDVPDIPL